jgi:RimJ/RimL family protein N-acetyltransferase
MRSILQGKSVYLSAVDPPEMAKAGSGWIRDSELHRLWDARARPLQSAKASRDSMEKEFSEIDDRKHVFSIRLRADDRLVGDLGFDVVHWSANDAFVGLGIADRDEWGKGYGTEAMQLGLQFAFTEINLRRVTLTVFEYNPRAIRSYEKTGFRHEGRIRQYLLREGRRWDMLYMGILREEWLAMNGPAGGLDHTTP